MLNGEAGNDTLFADAATNLSTLSSLSNFGGDEASGRLGDWVYGEIGNDSIFGGTGTDALFGGSGKDIMAGGAGDDVLSGDQMRELHVYEEKVTIESTGDPFGKTRYKVDISKPGSFISDKLLDVTLSAGGDDDILYGGAGNDRLHGGLGKDFLAGEKGNDVITGEQGDDYISGGDGNDALTGEYNNGTYGDGSKVLTHGNDYIDGGTGNDILQGEGGSDILYGGSDDDMIWGDAYYYNLLSAEQGDDLLDGGAGNDQLYGQGGNDILTGGSGDDILDGGEGDDIYIINAGDGNDRIFDTSGKNKIVFGSGVTQESIKLGLGSLKVNYGGTTNALHIEDFNPVDALAHSYIESFEFADGSILSHQALLARGFDLSGSGDIFGTSVVDRIEGSSVDDYIYARAGNDIVSAGEGADYVEGMEGDDILKGGSGDDQLSDGGDSGNLLDGGEGNDYLRMGWTATGQRSNFLVGGKGDDYVESQGLHDVFAFNAGDGVDTLSINNALTLSLGGGILSANLSVTMDGGDVILNAGVDGIRLRGILSDFDATTRPEIKLQIVGTDIKVFNFNAILDAFVTSTGNGGTPNSWSIAEVLASNQISDASTRSPIGGILAYTYAVEGEVDSINTSTIQAALSDPMFGVL